MIEDNDPSPRMSSTGPSPWPAFVVGERSRIHVSLVNQSTEHWAGTGPDQAFLSIAWVHPEGIVDALPQQTWPLRKPAAPGAVANWWPHVTPAPRGASHLRLVVATRKDPTDASRRILASEDMPVDVLQPREVASGTLYSDPLPKLPAGSMIQLVVSISNTSLTRWHSSGPDQIKLAAEGNAAPLPRDLLPGETIEMALAATIPSSPGRHIVQVRLNRGDFDMTGSGLIEPLDIPVEAVDPGEANVPELLRLEGPLLHATLAEPLAFGLTENEPGRLPLRIQNLSRDAVVIEGLEWRWRRFGEVSGNGTWRAQAVSRQLGTRQFSHVLADIGQPPGAGRWMIDIAIRALFLGIRQPPAIAGRVATEVAPRGEVPRGDISIPVPLPELVCGTQAEIAVEISNAGTRAWTSASAVEICVNWSTLDGLQDSSVETRVRLRRAPRPGCSEVQVVQFITPPVAGHYRLRLSLAPRKLFGNPSTCSMGSASAEVILLDAASLDWSTEKRMVEHAASARTAVARRAYELWARDSDTLPPEKLALLGSNQAAVSGTPLVSIIVLAGSRAAGNVEATLASLLSQTHRAWEALVLASGDLPRGTGVSDSRIRAVAEADSADEGRRFAAVLPQLNGRFIHVMDAGDRLAPHALSMLADGIARHPDASVFYGDHDIADADGRRSSPSHFAEPDADLWRCLWQDYPRCLVRSDVLRRVLSATDNAATTWRFALLLRLLEDADPSDIVHVSAMLLHRKSASDHYDLAGQGDALAALSSHLARTEPGAAVSALHARPVLRMHHRLPAGRPGVTVIIPTRNQHGLLQRCIASLLDRTRYAPLEIIVIDNGSDEDETLSYLEHIELSGTAKIIRDPAPFNWSRLNNAAARMASHPILCLLNNDIEALHESWLDEMVSQVLRPGVGVAGAELRYPSGDMQHGGVTFMPGLGHAHHAYVGQPRDDGALRLSVAQGYAAVTGACLVVKADVYRAVGGMDETLPVEFNDTDFCLRVAERLGLRTVWTPFAELLHKESASRGRNTSEDGRERSRAAFSALFNRHAEWMVQDQHWIPEASGLQARPGARHYVWRQVQSRKIGILHIPRCGGTVMRQLLSENVAAPGLMVLSPRTMLQVANGEIGALEPLQRRLGDAAVLTGTWAGGNARKAFGPERRLAVVLRDPVERAASAYAQLVGSLMSPLHGTELTRLPVQAMLRKGILSGNLMVRAILGLATEGVSWGDIERLGKTVSGGFAGYGIAARAWRGLMPDGPDVQPDADMGLVDQALDIIERDYLFVGRYEAIGTDLSILFSHLGMESTPVGYWQRGWPPSGGSDFSHAEIAALRAYNAIDIEFCRRLRIASDGPVIKD